MNWREKQNKLVSVGQNGYVGLIRSRTQSNTYTAVWILVVLFTPLPVSGNHVSAQFRNVMFLFILSFAPSFFVLLNLWICLTEALDLLRGFLAHHFGSMLKCQPRDAARIGKYEFGAAKL